LNSLQFWTGVYTVPEFEATMRTPDVGSEDHA
jgi:hypothetical protein